MMLITSDMLYYIIDKQTRHNGDDDLICGEDKHKYNADNYRHSFHNEWHLCTYIYTEDRRDCNNAAESNHRISHPTTCLTQCCVSYFVTRLGVSDHAKIKTFKRLSKALLDI